MTHPQTTFIDTWGWVALGNQRDNYHVQVQEVYNELIANRIPICTSDYVLDEVITLLFKRAVVHNTVSFVQGILQASVLGKLQLYRVTSEDFLATWMLRKQFQDKPLISFTDFTSMVIMRKQGIQRVLTQDDHFMQVGLGFVKIP